jgi:hypothetical protein
VVRHHLWNLEGGDARHASQVLLTSTKKAARGDGCDRNGGGGVSRGRNNINLGPAALQHGSTLIPVTAVEYLQKQKLLLLLIFPLLVLYSAEVIKMPSPRFSRLHRLPRVRSVNRCYC